MKNDNFKIRVIILQAKKNFIPPFKEMCCNILYVTSEIV